MTTQYEKADDRAKKFFERRHGGKEDKYWSSDHPDLLPTLMNQIRHSHYCAYCGEQAKPIQAGLSKPTYELIRPNSHYATTGHTCTCKEAMDELDVKAQIAEMKAAHRAAMDTLKSSLPQPSKQQGVALIKKLADWQAKQYSEGWHISFDGCLKLGSHE